MQLTTATNGTQRSLQLPLRRRTLCTLGVATTLTAALATARPAAADAVRTAALSDPVFSYDRPALYGVVREDVRVPLRDGSYLAAQLYRPAGADGKPARGRFPGIVYE